MCKITLEIIPIDWIIYDRSCGRVLCSHYREWSKSMIIRIERVPRHKVMWKPPDVQVCAWYDFF